MINSTSYIRMMSHTAAVNTSLFFNIRGRLISRAPPARPAARPSATRTKPSSTARSALMVAGGAEELSATQAAVFDTLFATS